MHVLVTAVYDLEHMQCFRNNDLELPRPPMPHTACPLNGGGACCHGSCPDCIPRVQQPAPAARPPRAARRQRAPWHRFNNTLRLAQPTCAPWPASPSMLPGLLGGTSMVILLSSSAPSRYSCLKLSCGTDWQKALLSCFV